MCILRIIREIDKFIIDPDYEKSSLDNDIALVKMDREVKF